MPVCPTCRWPSLGGEALRPNPCAEYDRSHLNRPEAERVQVQKRSQFIHAFSCHGSAGTLRLAIRPLNPQ